MKQRILLLLACLLLLAGCSQEPAETTPPAPPPVEHVTMVVTADTIGLLEEYPDLRSVDLSGSTCYEAIFQYIQSHPKVAVTYTVQLGTLTVSEDETDLILARMLSRRPNSLARRLHRINVVSVCASVS